MLAFLRSFFMRNKVVAKSYFRAGHIWGNKDELQQERRLFLKCLFVDIIKNDSQESVLIFCFPLS